jgi:CelD/BcsL family acetyltransferase involved in cellulose biosynthesis
MQNFNDKEISCLNLDDKKALVNTEGNHQDNIRLVEIKTISEMIKLKHEWNRLLFDSKDSTPFQSWQWNYAFVKDLKSSEKLKIVAGYNQEDKLVGIAPLKVTSHRISGIKMLEFIGSRESDYLDFLVEEEYKDFFITELFDFLDECRDWTMLDFASLREQTKKLISDQLCVQVSTQTVCPCAFLPSTMEQYEQLSNRREMKGIKRQLKKLLPQNSLTYLVSESNEDLKENVDKFIELHQMRHNSKGEKGHFRSKNQKEKLHKLSELMFRAGLLKMETLKIDSTIVAINFIFVLNKKKYNYLSGMHPGYSEFKPGKLLIYYMINDAIKKGYSTYDFLQGKEEYKYNWTNCEIQLYNVTYSRSKKRAYFWKKFQSLRRTIFDSNLVKKISEVIYASS